MIGQDGMEVSRPLVADGPSECGTCRDTGPEALEPVRESTTMRRLRAVLWPETHGQADQESE